MKIFAQILEGIWMLLTTGMIIWTSRRVEKLEKNRPDKADHEREETIKTQQSI